MKSLLVLSTAAALVLLAPISAQVTGSTNRKAPLCKSSIEFADGGMVELTYRSLTWAEGEFAQNLERMRGFINQQADRNPLGRLEVAKVGVMFGGKALPPSEYAMKFKVNEDLDWVLEIESEDGAVKYDWVLPLEKTDKLNTRLRLRVEAGKEDTSLQCHIAFGQQMCVVDGERDESIKGGKKDGDQDGDDHDGEANGRKND
jgi:hypothetical protein